MLTEADNRCGGVIHITSFNATPRSFVYSQVLHLRVSSNGRCNTKYAAAINTKLYNRARVCVRIDPTCKCACMHDHARVGPTLLLEIGSYTCCYFALKDVTQVWLHRLPIDLWRM